MSGSWLRSGAFAVAIAAGVAGWTAVPQTQTTPAAKNAGPRTPDGHPDFQGNYNIATLTPIERPDGVPLIISEADARRLERGEALRVQRGAEPSDANRAAPVAGGSVGGYNNFWIDRGDTVVTINGQRRSSLIVDPPDGKVPPLTAAARTRNATRPGQVALPTADAPESAGNSGAGAYDDPETRPLGERCLLGFGSTSGPPTMPNYFYNNLKQIVQTKDQIMILVEMVHDARIIRMNQPHLPPTIRKWMGDSVGHWEGDTLVVDTTNFSDKTRYRGSSTNLHVIERFSRLDDQNLLYRFTIEDPDTWTRPWTGEFPWVATDDAIYEYACHEGNHALEHILSGARYQETHPEKKP